MTLPNLSAPDILAIGLAALAVIVLILLIALCIRYRKCDGSLVIDTSDPTKDLYQIKLDTPLDDLPKKKTILLKVEVTNTINDISQ